MAGDRRRRGAPQRLGVEMRVRQVQQGMAGLAATPSSGFCCAKQLGLYTGMISSGAKCQL